MHHALLPESDPTLCTFAQTGGTSFFFGRLAVTAVTRIDRIPFLFVRLAVTGSFAQVNTVFVRKHVNVLAFNQLRQCFRWQQQTRLFRGQRRRRTGLFVGRLASKYPIQAVRQVGTAEVSLPEASVALSHLTRPFLVKRLVGA